MGKSYKDPHTCKGCGVENMVDRYWIKKQLKSGKEYRCAPCVSRGDGVGKETPKNSDKISTTCTGCSKICNPSYRHLKKIKSEKKPYICDTCNRRGAGIGKETPMWRDKVPQTCIKCKTENMVHYGSVKDLVKQGRSYVCAPCNKRGVRANTSLPLNTDKLPTECVGCYKTFNVPYSAISKIELAGRDYRCLTCTSRGDGVSNLAPLTWEKVKQDCCGCKKSFMVRLNTINSNTRTGKSYRCWDCAHRGDGVGKETPLITERIPLNCRECGTENKVLGYNIRYKQKQDATYKYICSKCACKNQSSQEQEIIDFLLSQGLAKSEDVIQGDRKLLGGKEIDIYLPKHKVGIEYNGNYWHSEENRKDKNIHFHKRLLAEKAGIRLVQIRSDEWEQKSDLVKSMLKNILGLSDKVYHARKLNVRAVSRSESYTFLKANHLMGAYSSGRSIGLFTAGGELVQIFVYKLLKSKTELHCSRICSQKNVTVVGGVSRLIKYAVESHPLIQTIVSFVDLRYADGHSLKMQGFNLKSTTLGFGWTDGKYFYNRLRCKANMDERKLTQARHAEELGWFKLWDAGQAKLEKSI